MREKQGRTGMNEVLCLSALRLSCSIKAAQDAKAHSVCEGMQEQETSVLSPWSSILESASIAAKRTQRHQNLGNTNVRISHLAPPRMSLPSRAPVFNPVPCICLGTTGPERGVEHGNIHHPKAEKTSACYDIKRQISDAHRVTISSFTSS